MKVSHIYIQTGDPRKMILRKANEWEPTYIVLGARGSGEVEDLEIGSVASYILRKAKCSVILVKS